MRRTRLACLLALAALASPPALAHTLQLELSVRLSGGRVEMTAAAPGGAGVSGARLEYFLLDEAGATNTASTTAGGPLKDEGGGLYRAAAPRLAPGAYSLLVRDTTFPGETVEKRLAVRWPPAAPVRLVLPPLGGAPSAGLLVTVMLAPVLLALGVLGWSLLRRPRPGSGTPG